MFRSKINIDKLKSDLPFTLLNFKMLISHREDNLTLVKEGILGSCATSTKIDPKVKQCIQHTYQSIKQLFELSPKELFNLDFDLCEQLMSVLHEWSNNKQIPILSDQQWELRKFLNKCELKITQFEKNTQAKKNQKYPVDIIEPKSFDELFERKSTTNTHPNFLFIMTDEEGPPSGYADDCVKEDYNNLPGKKAVSKNGIKFTKHNTSETACTPSRGTLFTGQHHSLHQLSQTTGGSKQDDDPDMRWLIPGTVPTMGNYFQAAGYDTVFKGKWHLTPENIPDKKMHEKSLKPVNGKVNEAVRDEYIKRNPLKRFGFDEWVGPDLHGISPENSAFNRDAHSADEMCTWLKARHQNGNKKSFFAVLSLLNPHDIVFVPALYLYYLARYNLPGRDKQLDITHLPPSIADSLSDKPAVQKSFRDRYSKMFCLNAINGSENGRFRNWNWFNYYYQDTYSRLVRQADEKVAQVVETLERLPDMYDNTIIVCTSDHADSRAAHGLIQKFYNTYTETIRCPLIISNPHFVNKGKCYNHLTTHLDILPTLLRLANLDEKKLNQSLALTHNEVHKLPGRPIGNRATFTILNTEKYKILECAYFHTVDDIMEGATPYGGIARIYPFLQAFPSIAKVESIKGNTDLHMVEAKLLIHNKPCHYKYALYHQSPMLYTINPLDPTIKTIPEEEFYDELNDPCEMRNLAKEYKLNPTDAIALEAMRRLLKHEQQLKLTQPYDIRHFHNPEKVTVVKQEGPGYDFLFVLAVAPTLAVVCPAKVSATLFAHRRAIGNAVKKVVTEIPGIVQDAVRIIAKL